MKPVIGNQRLRDALRDLEAQPADYATSSECFLDCSARLAAARFTARFSAREAVRIAIRLSDRYSLSNLNAAAVRNPAGDRIFDASPKGTSRMEVSM
jgi:hypothetical protein